MDQLKKNRIVQIKAQGGAGKTYFAVEVANSLPIRLKFWLSFKNTMAVVQQFNEILEQLYTSGVVKTKPSPFLQSEADDLESFGEKVRNKLEKLGQEFLMIMDNLHEDPFLAGFMEGGPLVRGYLVITGRYDLQSVKYVYMLKALEKAKCV